MPFSPTWLQILPMEKYTAAIELMRQLDTSLYQRSFDRQPLIITLNRATYDSQLLKVVKDTYGELGWRVDITDQSGALMFTFTAQQRQETS
jgi:hypothetical protein